MLKKNISIARKNFSYLLSSEVIIRIMMLVLTIYLARTYGTEKFGIYALAFSIGNLFEIIFNFGLGTVFMQRVAASPETMKEQLGIFLPLRILLSLTSFIAFTIFALLLGKNQETFLALMLASFYFSIFSFETFIWNCFDARQKMHFTAGIKFLEYLIIFGVGIFCIWTQYPIYSIFFGYIGGAAATIVLSLFLINRYFSHMKPSINIVEWKKILYEGWPIALSGTFVFVYNYLDTIIISMTKGEYDVGLYQVSYKIIGTLFLLAGLINQAYFPSFIQTHKNNPGKLGQIFNKTLRSIFFWSVPITLGGSMLAERIILFIFGPEYLPGTTAFKILIWNCPIFFLSSAMTTLLYALKKQRTTMKIFFAGALINTLLNIIIIPIFGINGAALTTILAELTVLTGIYMITKKFLRMEILKSIAIPAIAGLIMAIAIIFIRIENLPLTTAFGATIYFGAYFLLRQFAPEEHLTLEEGLPTPEFYPKDQP